jgi:hypothetical protein
MNKNLIKLNIFNKYVKNNFKSIPFTNYKNLFNKTKYFPSIAKEWKNSLYAFNQNHIMNMSASNDININSLVKYYFNLRFFPEFIFKKYRPRWIRRPSMNRIFVSKAEVKHTNSKAIITVYNYNREKVALLKNIDLIIKSFNSKIELLIIKNGEYFNDLSLITIKGLLRNELKILRRFKLKLNLNKYKFEEKLLYKLRSIIEIYYNKRVEFNFVNMKSIVLNSDIFTKILGDKLWKRKISTLHNMNFILNKAVIAEKSRINNDNSDYINNTLLDNKFKDTHLISILKSNNLNTFLKETYNNIISENNLYKNYTKMYEIIFNSIKYKNMAGLRLEAKGRLSKRYRADRSIYLVKWKGGLKNFYSSRENLSTIRFRGYLNSNVERSMFASKRRIGAFAVKGWVSGK